MSAVRLLAEYAEVKNQHDVEEMVRRTHDDVVYRDAGGNKPIRGRAAIEQFHRRVFAAVPDYSAAIEDITGNDDTAVAWGRVRGVLAAPLFGYGRAGDRLDAAAVFVLEFRDGLLYRERAQLDLSALSQRPSPAVDAFLDAFTAAWARPTAAGLTDLFDVDATVLHPGMSKPLTGRSAIRGHFEQVVATMPDVSLQPITTSVTGDTVFVHWRMSATIAGSPTSWEGIDRFDLRGDRARAGVACFDRLALQATALGRTA